jgi:hypothetical protein
MSTVWLARVLALSCLALAVYPVSVWSVSPAADVVLMPPDFEQRSSPSGAYALEVRLRPQANAFAPRASATLFELGPSPRKVLWTRELPHRPRPRFFLVGDGGQVVLLDEWLNVRSDLAVMVIDRENRTLGQFNLEAVRAALDVPIAALAPRARHGPWIQATPQISARGDAVEVAAADRVLSIRLSDGTLSVR